MLKLTHKLLAGGLPALTLALTLVVVSLLAGGVPAWTPAAQAQGTIPPAPGDDDQGTDQGSNDNSQDTSQDTSGGSSSQDISQENTQATFVSSPEHPLPYSDQWMTIQPGEWQWFAFKYSFDSSRNSDDDKSNDQEPANLRLDAEPENGVSLILVNREQVRDWQDGEKLEGFGAATPASDRVENEADLDDFCKGHPDDPVCSGGGNTANSACENLRNPAHESDHCKYRTSESRGYSNWKGTIASTGTYYIVVRGDPRATGPIRYKFTFSGEGLTMR